MAIDNINDPWRNEEEEPEIHAAPPPAASPDQEQENAPVEPAEQVQQPSGPEPDDATARNLARIRDVVENGTGATRGLTETGELANPQEPEPEPEAVPPDATPNQEPPVDWSNIQPGEGYDSLIKARENEIAAIKAKLEYIRKGGGSAASQELGDDRSIDAALNGYRLREDFTEEAGDFLGRLEQHVDDLWQKKYDQASGFEKWWNRAKVANSMEGRVELAQDLIDVASMGTKYVIGAGVSDAELERLAERIDARGERRQLSNLSNPSDEMQLADIRSFEDAGKWFTNLLADQSPIIVDSMAGAAAGAAVGSILPGIGTAIGGGVGLVGGVIRGAFVKAGEKAGISAAKKAAFGAAKKKLVGEIARKAALREAAREAAGKTTREAIAKRVGAEISSLAIDFNYNLSSSLEAIRNESLARGRDELDLGQAVMQASLRTVADYANPIRKAAVGAATGRSVNAAANAGIMHTARSWWGAVGAMGRALAKDAGWGAVSFEGETLADRITNYAYYGTPYLQGEHSLSDALWHDANSIASGAAMAFTGTANQYRAAMANRQANMAADIFGSRIAADDIVFSRQRSARDEAASPSFKRLDTKDQRLICAIANVRAKMEQGATLERNSDAEEAQRGANKRAAYQTEYVKLKKELSTEGRKWLAAYESNFDQNGIGEFERAVKGDPATAARLASDLAPDVDYQEMFGAFSDKNGDVDIKRLAKAVIEAGDGGLAIQQGNVQIRCAFEENDGTLNFSVTRTDGGAMPERFCTEFCVADFSENGAQTNQAAAEALHQAVTTAQTLSSFAKWSTEQDAHVVEYANRLVAGTGRNVAIVRTIEDLVNLMRGKTDKDGKPLMHVLQNGDVYIGRERVSGDLPNGFSGTWRGFTSPDGTVVVNRSAFSNYLELAAILDHESFHSRIFEIVEDAMKNGTNNVGKGDISKSLFGRENTPENMRRAIWANILGEDLSAPKYLGLSDIAIDNELASIEEGFAYNAEGMVPQKMRVPLFQRVMQNMPALAKTISVYLSEKFGQSPRTQEELADYFFTVMSKTKRDGESVVYGVPGTVNAEDVNGSALGEEENASTSRDLLAPSSDRGSTREQAGDRTGRVADTRANRKSIGQLVIDAFRDGRVETKDEALARRLVGLLQPMGVEINNARVENGTWKFDVNQAQVAELLFTALSRGQESQEAADVAAELIVNLAESMGKEVGIDEDGNIVGVFDVGTIPDEGAVEGSSAMPRRQPAPKQNKGLVEGPKERTEKPKEPARKTGPTDADRVDMARQKAPVAPKSEATPTVSENQTNPKPTSNEQVISSLEANGAFLKMPFVTKTDARRYAPTTKANQVVANFAGRRVVAVELNGVRVPFYLSTGHGGKKTVSDGKWYPFFGIAAGGWMNKGTESQINDYFGSRELRAVAEWLDANIGDIQPLGQGGQNMMKFDEDGNAAFLGFINRDLAPIEHSDSATKEGRAKLDKSIASVVSSVQGADLSAFGVKTESKPTAVESSEKPSAPPKTKVRTDANGKRTLKKQPRSVKEISAELEKSSDAFYAEHVMDDGLFYDDQIRDGGRVDWSEVPEGDRPEIVNGWRFHKMDAIYGDGSSSGWVVTLDEQWKPFKKKMAALENELAEAKKRESEEDSNVPQPVAPAAPTQTAPAPVQQNISQPAEPAAQSATQRVSEAVGKGREGIVKAASDLSGIDVGEYLVEDYVSDPVRAKPHQPYTRYVPSEADYHGDVPIHVGVLAGFVSERFDGLTDEEQQYNTVRTLTNSGIAERMRDDFESMADRLNDNSAGPLSDQDLGRALALYAWMEDQTKGEEGDFGEMLSQASTFMDERGMDNWADEIIERAGDFIEAMEDYAERELGVELSEGKALKDAITERFGSEQARFASDESLRRSTSDQLTEDDRVASIASIRRGATDVAERQSESYNEGRVPPVSRRAETNGGGGGEKAPSIWSAWDRNVSQEEIDKIVDEYLSDPEDISVFVALAYFDRQAKEGKNQYEQQLDRYAYERIKSAASRSKFNPNATSLRIADGGVSLDDAKRVFEKLNADKDIGRLASLVFDAVRDYKLDIRVDDSAFASERDGVTGLETYGHIDLRSSYLRSPFVSDQTKAITIIHEMIHAMTQHAIDGVTAGIIKDEQIVKAVRSMKEVYDAAIESGLIDDFNGSENVHEFYSYLTKPSFREALSQKPTLIQRAIRALRDLVMAMIGRSPAVKWNQSLLDAAESALGRLLSTDSKTWQSWFFSKYGMRESMPGGVLAARDTSVPSGVQKSADVNYPDAGAEIASARFASDQTARFASMDTLRRANPPLDSLLRHIGNNLTGRRRIFQNPAHHFQIERDEESPRAAVRNAIRFIREKGFPEWEIRDALRKEWGSGSVVERELIKQMVIRDERRAGKNITYTGWKLGEGLSTRDVDAFNETMKEVGQPTTMDGAFTDIQRVDYVLDEKGNTVERQVPWDDTTLEKAQLATITRNLLNEADDAASTMLAKIELLTDSELKELDKTFAAQAKLKRLYNRLTGVVEEENARQDRSQTARVADSMARQPDRAANGLFSASALQHHRSLANKRFDAISTAIRSSRENKPFGAQPLLDEKAEARVQSLVSMPAMGGRMSLADAIANDDAVAGIWAARSAIMYAEMSQKSELSGSLVQQVAARIARIFADAFPEQSEWLDPNADNKKATRNNPLKPTQILAWKGGTMLDEVVKYELGPEGTRDLGSLLLLGPENDVASYVRTPIALDMILRALEQVAARNEGVPEAVFERIDALRHSLERIVLGFSMDVRQPRMFEIQAMQGVRNVLAEKFPIRDFSDAVISGVYEELERRESRVEKTRGTPVDEMLDAVNAEDGLDEAGFYEGEENRDATGESAEMAEQRRLDERDAARSRFASDASLAMADPNLVAAALYALRVKNDDGSFSYSTRVADLLRYTRIANADPHYTFWEEKTNFDKVMAAAKAVAQKDPGALQAAVQEALSAWDMTEATGRRADYRTSASQLALLRANLVMRQAEVKEATDALFEAEAKSDGSVNIQDLRAAVAEKEALLSRAVHATAFAESAAGTALGSLSRLVKEDLSLGEQMRQAEKVIRNTKGITAENRGPLTASEIAKLKEIAGKYEKVCKECDALLKEKQDGWRKEYVDGKIEEGVREARKGKAAGRKAKSVAEAVEAARKALADGETVDISVYPELWAQIGDAVKGIAQAIIDEHLEGPSRLKALDHAEFAKRLLTETNRAYEGLIVSRDTNHQQLTERDVLDLYSDYAGPDKLQDGYGATNIDEGRRREAHNRLRELSRMRSALEDIKAGRPPLEAYGHLRNLEPAQVDEELARVRKELDDAFRQSGISTDLLNRQMSPIDLARESLERRIEEIKKNLAAGEIAKKEGRGPLVGEEGLASLREELAFLQSVQNATFKNRGLTDNERMQKIEEMYRKREKAASDELLRLMSGGRPVKPLDMSDDGARSAWAHADAEWKKKAGEARRAAAAASRNLNELRKALQSESYKGERALEMALARKEDLIARWQDALAANRVTLVDTSRNGKFDKYDQRLVEVNRQLKNLVRQKNERIAQIAFDRKNKFAQVVSKIWQAPNLQRIVQASGDLSSIGVQCAVAVLANPIHGMRAVIPGVKAFWGGLFNKPEYTEAFFEKLRQDPDFNRIADFVAIPETDGRGGFLQGATEEFFNRKAVQDRFPKLFGYDLFDNAYLRASEAGFNVPVALIRFSLAKKLIQQMRTFRGENYKPTDDEMRLIGNVVNAATGKGKWLADGSKVNLSGLLWAASRVSGQVESLAIVPRLLAHGEVGSDVRWMISKELILRPMLHFTEAMLLLGLAHAMFKDEDDDDPFLEIDPRSSKFLRAKIGNRYISITGGLEQYVVLLSKAVSGQVKTKDGEIIKLRGEGAAYGRAWSDELWRMFKSKVRPDIGLAMQMLDAKTATGKRIQPTWFGKDGRLLFLVNNTVMPLTARDIIEAGVDIGENGMGVTTALASIAVLGYNGSDFGENAYTKDRAKIDRVAQARRDMKNGKEGAAEKYAAIAGQEAMQRYISASESKRVKRIGDRITELDELLERGEPKRAKKSGPILSRRMLTRQERKAAQEEKERLEAEYHELVWPELKRIR